MTKGSRRVDSDDLVNKGSDARKEKAPLKLRTSKQTGVQSIQKLKIQQFPGKRQ